MLHPVGKLPAAVYWRRRLVVLVLLLAVLGGLGWGGFLVLRNTGDDTAESTDVTSTRRPQLEQVVPSMDRVITPTPPELTADVMAEAGTEPDAETAAESPAGPAAGDPCGDDMIAVTVRAPTAVASGTKPTFELLISNVSAVPCVRALDKGLQELVISDPAGTRVWGSNDCFPEASNDTRTLTPGETVRFPIVWGGLSSEPTCTATRSPLPPGSYLLRGRLDTVVSADVPLRVG